MRKKSGGAGQRVDKGRVKGEQGAEQGAGLPMGVPPHHLQKHNKGRDFRWESYRTTCKSTIKELKRQHTSKLAEGSGRGERIGEGGKLQLLQKRVDKKKGGQGVGQGAGLPMGVPPHHLQKPNKRTKETTYKQACVVSTALLLLSVPRAGLEPAQPSLAKGF